MGSENQFPIGFPLGDLCGKEFMVPYLVPSDAGGLFIEYSEHQEVEVNTLLENCILGLLSLLPQNLLQIHVFDFGFKKRFPYLADLQTLGVYNIYLNSQKADWGLQKLEDISRDRHHDLLSIDHPTLNSFNRSSDYPYPYHLMVINLSYFPESYINPKRFADFVESARDAGIYLFVFADIDQVDLSEKRLHSLKDNLPAFSLADGELTHEPGLLLADLERLSERFGLKAFPGTDNRDRLASDLLNRSSTTDADEPTDFLEIPIGRSPDGRLTINFSLGEKSENYHAIITGTTGTGKSTLLNNLIVGIAENFTAQELRLYLMDFKQGVEHKVFSEHPNCEKIFLGSDNLDAATDVLESFVNLMKERNALFRRYPDVKDISSYNGIAEKKMPRVLLIIDEVHGLFSGDYKRQDLFRSLLSSVATQGRSFGIHLILSTQTIAGSINQSLGELMAQFSLRITYRLIKPQDAEAVMSMGNLAPLKLNKFELIYNNGSGLKENNVLCRVDPPKDILASIKRIRNSRGEHEMIAPEIIEKVSGGGESEDRDANDWSTQYIESLQSGRRDQNREKAAQERDQHKEFLAQFAEKHDLDVTQIQGLSGEARE